MIELFAEFVFAVALVSVGFGLFVAAVCALKYTLFFLYDRVGFVRRFIDSRQPEEFADDETEFEADVSGLDEY